MDVFVPIDASETSDRALEFAIQLADRYDGNLHVVHLSDAETEATEQVLAEAREMPRRVACRPRTRTHRPVRRAPRGTGWERGTAARQGTGC